MVIIAELIAKPTVGLQESIVVLSIESKQVFANPVQKSTIHLHQDKGFHLPSSTTAIATAFASAIVVASATPIAYPSAIAVQL